MKQLFILCFLIAGVVQISQAQQTALTSDGKLIILHDDGTWQYSGTKASDTASSQTEITIKSNIPDKVSPTTVAPAAPISLKDSEVAKSTFIEGPSKKLQKYFKDKNIVRCDFTLKSKDGKAILQTDWKVMTGEAYSYFGFIRKGNKLSLELINGQSVDLFYNEEFEPKEFEKYGFSVYSARLEITKDQVNMLRNKLVVKAHMNWSKRTEGYKVVDPSYFIKSLPEIIGTSKN